MVFCGKCGLQLTSRDIVCPRCGTHTEPELIVEESQPNSPTIASSSNFMANQPYPGTQSSVSPGPSTQQEPLILGPDGNNYAAAEQMADQTTSMVGSQPPVRPSYPGYMPQSATNYPQQRASYAGYPTQGTATYQHYPTSPAEAAKNRARGRLVALLLILLGLLLILGAMVLFLLTNKILA